MPHPVLDPSEIAEELEKAKQALVLVNHHLARATRILGQDGELESVARLISNSNEGFSAAHNLRKEIVALARQHFNIDLRRAG